MLEALTKGARNPGLLAGTAQGALRSKIAALVDPLTGRFKPHHAFMARLHLDQIDAHTRVIDALTARIEKAMVPFRDATSSQPEAEVTRPSSPSSIPSSPRPDPPRFLY
ncbi:hypothetical protein AB4Y95_21145 [Arthrobacter sp. M-10]|uniref:hypothetical protein n=1 Tax=Arthrobacter sp. M-10 TaxID=3233037 RepID=UPI003F908262